MNGILNLIKPPGMTSFDVVAYIRGITRTRKTGHTGTLDPEAAGVLTLCLGNATQAIETLTEKDKIYRAELTFGLSTDTQDSTGRVLSACADFSISKEKLSGILDSFIGEYHQIPPMYSSVKIGGKKLYEYARKDIEIERKARIVFIRSINLIEFDGVKALFTVQCSKGTYIRTLCSDIGERAGVPAHMSFLLRMKSGRFDLDDCYTLEQVAGFSKKGVLQDYLLPAEVLYSGLPKVTADNEQMKKLFNGMTIRCKDNNTEIQVRVYSSNGRFAGIADVLNRSYIRLSKRFAVPEDL